MKRTILFAVLAALTLAASAVGATKDPRKCAAVTPGGPTKHAYWCAKAAAVTATQTKMAALQHVTRWYAPTYCTQASTVLRWNCTTILSGKTWNVKVWFRATSSGWRTTVTVRP